MLINIAPMLIKIALVQIYIAPIKAAFAPVLTSIAPIYVLIGPVKAVFLAASAPFAGYLLPPSNMALLIGNNLQLGTPEALSPGSSPCVVLGWVVLDREATRDCSGY